MTLMKSIILKIFLLAALLYKIASAQTLYLGFHNEFSFIYTNNKYGKDVVFNPGSLYGILGIKIINEVNFETRLGYMFSMRNDYGGPEVGFYLRSPIFYKRLYFLSGINFHVNVPNNPDLISKTVLLGGIGVGAYVYKLFLLEAVYFYPIQKEYISYGPFVDNPKLSGILKLGIGFNFVH